MGKKDTERNAHLVKVLAVIASPFVLIGGCLQLFLSYSDHKTTPGDFLFPVCFLIVLAVLYFLITGKPLPAWISGSKK